MNKPMRVVVLVVLGFRPEVLLADPYQDASPVKDTTTKARVTCIPAAYSASNTNDAQQNTTNYDLGWFPAGTKLTVGTCTTGVLTSSESGTQCMVPNGTSQDTRLRLFDGAGHELTSDGTPGIDDVDEQHGVYCSKIQYLVGANTLGYDANGAHLNLHAGCYGTTACSGQISYYVQNAHSGITLDQLPAPVTGSPVNSDDPPEQLDMTSGRLSKVPASMFYQRTDFQPTTAAHNLLLWSTCSTGDDIAMYVQVKSSPGTSGTKIAAYFNDDASDVDKNPWMLLSGAAGYYYDLYAFSKTRNTANCTIKYQVQPSGGVWSTAASVPLGGASSNRSINPAQIGGTLVKLGPLATNDIVEVETYDDGNSDDTVMALFDLGSANCTYGLHGSRCSATTGLLWNDDRAYNDLDSSITVPNGYSSHPRNYALVGRYARSNSSNRGLEARVDLVHGPLDEYLTGGVSFPVAGGAGAAPITMSKAGRAYMYMYANVVEPVGDSSSAPYNHAAYVPNCGITTNDTASYRNHLNEGAFQLDAQYSSDGGVTWYTQVSRVVPRALIAGPPLLGGVTQWYRFTLPFEVTNTGYKYRLKATKLVSDVSFNGLYNAVRNPSMSEIKVAEQNVGGEGEFAGYYDYSKVRNAANLLGTRGSFDWSSAGSVHEEPDQAPYEWDSDIVGLLEMAPSSTQHTGGGCNPAGENGSLYSPSQSIYDVPWTFKDQAEKYDSEDWSYVTGHDGDYAGGTINLCLAGGPPGIGGAFVRQNLFPDPNGLRSSVAWSTAPSGCQSGSDIFWEGGVPAAQNCYLGSDSGFSGGDNFMIPAKAVVHRPIKTYSPGLIADSSNNLSLSDRPIGVFVFHLSTSGQGERRDEITQLTSVVSQMISAHASSFNINNDPSPTAAGNRIILMGDGNFYAHQCGEQYWLLHQLREAFGYALDVTQAVDGAPDNKFAMHDSGEGTDPFGIPKNFVPITGPDYTDPWGIHRYAWIDARSAGGNNSFLMGPNNPFPFWSTVYHRFTSDAHGTDHTLDRVNVIWLVGRGWALDDPVLSYNRMWNTNDPDDYVSGVIPMSWDQKCVNTGYSVYDGRKQSCTNRPGKAYRPRCNLASNNLAGASGVTTCYGAGSAGDPALNAEHIPIGTKLRLWVR